jgi:hypothetical protein
MWWKGKQLKRTESGRRDMQEDSTMGQEETENLQSRALEAMRCSQNTNRSRDSLQRSPAHQCRSFGSSWGRPQRPDSPSVVTWENSYDAERSSSTALPPMGSSNVHQYLIVCIHRGNVRNLPFSTLSWFEVIGTSRRPDREPPPLSIQGNADIYICEFSLVQ